MVDKSEYFAEGTEDNEMTSILLRIAQRSIPLKKTILGFTQSYK